MQSSAACIKPPVKQIISESEFFFAAGEECSKTVEWDKDGVVWMRALHEHNRLRNKSPRKYILYTYMDSLG